MLTYVTRLEGHESRAVHVLHPNSGRGLILHYVDRWDLVKMADVTKQVIDRDFKEEGEWLTKAMSNENAYLVHELPDAEFEVLYRKVSSAPNVIFENEFDPNETPQLKFLIESSGKDYLMHIVRSLSMICSPASRQ